jgi:hypothetical protein
MFPQCFFWHQENKKRAQPGADEIQFPEFANCLARLALIVFAPKSDNGLPFSARPKSSRASFETWRVSQVIKELTCWPHLDPLL